MDRRAARILEISIRSMRGSVHLSILRISALRPGSRAIDQGLLPCRCGWLCHQTETIFFYSAVLDSVNRGGPPGQAGVVEDVCQVWRELAAIRNG